MKRHILCALSLALMVGCNEVEDRLTWSPDGKQAALRVDDDLYLMDASGKLTGIVASNVTGAAWLPNGRGLVLTRCFPVAKWTEAESLLPASEIAAAKMVGKAWLAFGVDGADQLELKRPELASAAILFLSDTQSNELHEAIQKSKDAAKLEADLSNMRTTQVAEVSVVALDGKQLRLIVRTLMGLEQARPSPVAPVLAFLEDKLLTVAPLDGGTNGIAVTDKLAGTYDWTPDGKALVYSVRQGDKDAGGIQFAEINRHLLIESNGVWMAGDMQLLAMNATTFEPRVRCMPDSRVLFAGIPLQLPGRATGAAQFYAIDPALGTNAVPVAIPTAAGTLPQDLAAFAPSPDGRQIAIVESGSDSVGVLDVATGNLEVVSPRRGWKSKILPAWRGSNELFFAALPAASTNRPELFRWRKGSAPVAISTNWPDAVVNTLLQKPQK